MRDRIRRAFYDVIGQKNTAALRVYSPVTLARGILAKHRYQRYADSAKAAYGGPVVRNPTLSAEGFQIVRKVFPVNPELLSSIYRAFDSADCTSYKKGFIVRGVDRNAEYTYLSKRALLELGLVETAVTLSVFDSLEAHLGSYVRIVNIAAMKTYPNTHSDLGSFLWHRDGQPFGSYKLLVYLTSVSDVGAGPFCYLPNSSSGFHGIPHFGNTRRSSPESFTTFFGEPGDGVLFDINGYHVGGRSKTVERIVLVISVRASKTPRKEHLEKFGFGSVGDPEFGLQPETAWWS